MRKKDTWTDSGGLIRCVACDSTNTELCDARRRSGTYNRQIRCLDCNDLRTVKLPRPTDAELQDARRRSGTYSLRNPIKLASVRAWWEANAHKGYTSASGARACSVELEMPINTVRGLQRDAYLGDEAPPWKATNEPPATVSAVEDEDEEIKPIRDRVADAAAGRAAARQPRPPKKASRYLIDDDGLFQPVKAGEPLHVCPTCGAQAHTHFDLLSRFGIRTDKRSGARRPQSLCTPCRTAHGRARRKTQLDLPALVEEQATPPRAMKQGELDEIARLAAAALRNGAAGVELEVKDDPRVALALDVEVVSASLYPLCPGGPLGLIVSCDPNSDTGILRLRFDAVELRDWALAQGAKIITEPVINESAMSAYQNPPGLAELVGGRR